MPIYHKNVSTWKHLVEWFFLRRTIKQHWPWTKRIELQFICWLSTTNMRFHSAPWARHKSTRHNRVGRNDHEQHVSSPLTKIWPQWDFCSGIFEACCSQQGTNISLLLLSDFYEVFSEGYIPLNPKLPANAHGLIWIWGVENYTAISFKAMLCMQKCCTVWAANCILQHCMYIYIILNFLL